MANLPSHASGSPGDLVLLADGALLGELNQRLRDEGARFLDFTTLPSEVARGLGSPFGEPSRESCYFFTVGSQSAEGFVSRISGAWTVQTYPLRSSTVPCAQCGNSTVTFSTAIAWALGRASAQTPPPTVVCVSSDVRLIMPIRFSREGGMDTRLCWPGPLSEEVRFFAQRNGVPLLELQVREDMQVRSDDSFGKSFLFGRRSSGPARNTR